MSVHRTRPSAPSSRPGDLERDPIGRIRYRAVPDRLCDFCGDPLTGKWRRYESTDFTRELPSSIGPAVVRFIGYWGACTPCTPYVDARDWPRLIDRVIAAHDARYEHLTGHLRDLLRSEIAATYLQLERALTGRSFTVGVAA